LVFQKVNKTKMFINPSGKRVAFVVKSPNLITDGLMHIIGTKHFSNVDAINYHCLMKLAIEQWKDKSRESWLRFKTYDKKIII
jgi:hypothetical protein